MTQLLEARHVTKLFSSGLLDRHATVALEDFSLAIDSERPSITAVVGESGSGKTTLARLLLGLVAPTRGEGLYQGQDLQNMSQAAWRTFRRDVQLIFQDPYEVYNPFYRVDHVLTTPVAKFQLASSKAAARALIAEVLQVVGLRPEETLGRFPHQLSGGQRQRVMVARALLLRPRLIVADEPVSMVDASLRATILDALRTMHLERSISLVYITHDLATAYYASDRVAVMLRGWIVELGPVEEVLGAPKHPYTQLLKASVLEPDPRQRTTSRVTLGAQDQSSATQQGCRFADRCPLVMDKCHTLEPPDVQVDRRLVKCHLFTDATTSSPTGVSASAGSIA